MYLLSVLCFSFLFVSVQSSVGNPWDYQGELGPSHWHVDYPHCGGKEQSPINIDIDHVKYDPTLEHMDTCAYQDCDGVYQELKNVGGHTAEVEYRGKPIIVTGGGLAGEYVLDQFHFHWGSEDSKGSEHTINGSPYSMEMHIVHHSNSYDNISEAMDKPNGLAVNAFFFQVGRHNPAFTELLSHFPKILHADDKTELERAIKLSDLLPKDMEVYYRYDGSLTTPPCFETVTWTIFKTPIVISERQLNVFRSLKRNREGEPERPLVNDFRPTQPLNHRTVWTNSQRGLMSSHQIGTCGLKSHNGYGTCNGGSNNCGKCNGGSNNCGKCNGGSNNCGKCNGGSNNCGKCNGGSNNCGKCNARNRCRGDGDDDDDDDGHRKCNNGCGDDGDE